MHYSIEFVFENCGITEVYENVYIREQLEKVNLSLSVRQQNSSSRRLNNNVNIQSLAISIKTYLLVQNFVILKISFKKGWKIFR